MSTKQRYGTMIWNAVNQLHDAFITSGNLVYTVGEVAQKAEVSQPTAAKYLKILAKDGYLIEYKTNSGIKFYAMTSQVMIGRE